MHNEFAKCEIKTSVFSGRKPPAGNYCILCHFDPNSIWLLLPRQPRSAQILTADSVQQQPIAAPEGSEINHGIHRNTRKRESESTSPFRVLPGGGPTPAGWGAPPVGWGRSVVTRLYRTSWHDRCVCYD